MFQFRNGSIKSLETVAEEITLISFNSEMVRLKAGHGAITGRRYGTVSIPKWFD